MRSRVLAISLVAGLALLAAGAQSVPAGEAVPPTHSSLPTAYAPLPSAPLASPAPFAALPSAEPQRLVASLMAFIDPETGMLTGPIGALQVPTDLNAPAEPDYSQLPQIQLPDGSFMIDTHGLMLDNFVLHVDAFGRRAFSCTHDAHQVLEPAPVVLSPYAER